MFCSNCGSQFEVVPLAIGKSKFCRNCGSLIYRNIDGIIVYGTEAESLSDPGKVESENAERVRREDEQRKLIEQELKVRERQLQLLKEQEDKRKQEQLEKERIERIKAEEAERIERKKAEEERKIAEEKERQLRLQLEREIRDKINREIADRERLEQELKSKIERERIEKELREQEELARHDEEVRISIIENEETDKPTANKRFIYILPVIFILLLAGLAAFYLINPEKTKSLLGISTIQPVLSANSGPDIHNTDSSLANEPSKIKQAITNQTIWGWSGQVRQEQIQSVTIDSSTDSYKIVTISLKDTDGTQAVSKVRLNYANNDFTSLKTEQITYKNKAPVNKWFFFQPLQNCAIYVNTNNQSIRIKGCQNCPEIKMNTNYENKQKLLNHPATVFITSDSNTDAVIDFIYYPE